MENNSCTEKSKQRCGYVDEIEKLPCLNCACPPICRYRSYHMVIETCSLIFNYFLYTNVENLEGHPKIHTDKLQKYCNYVKPIGWGVGKNGIIKYLPM